MPAADERQMCSNGAWDAQRSRLRTYEECTGGSPAIHGSVRPSGQKCPRQEEPDNANQTNKGSSEGSGTSYGAIASRAGGWSRKVWSRVSATISDVSVDSAQPFGRYMELLTTHLSANEGVERALLPLRFGIDHPDTCTSASRGLRFAPSLATREQQWLPNLAAHPRRPAHVFVCSFP
jgi:hypothetical protein